LSLHLQGETIIRKVQISAPSRQDVLLARLRVESALQAASLRPPGLPPSAILVIKRVADPHLGRLTASRPDYAATQTWARTFDLHVAALSKRAARPFHGPVASDAQAVLFADQAELLACLALNWLDGSLSAHWWWRSIFPNADFSGLIPSAFVESAPDIPAALEILARIGRVADFSRRLDAPLARAMFAALLRAFDLPALEQALLIPDSPRVQPKKSQIQDIVVGLGGQSAPAQASPAAQPDNPFETMAPEVASIPGLLPEAQNLLGIALMLRRAPAVVRSEEFAARLTAWQAAGRPIRARAARTTMDGPVRTQTVQEDAQPVGVVEPAKSGEDSPLPTFASRQNIQQVEHQQKPAALHETHLSPTPVVRVTETSFGGVFYLLNLVVFLEIYGDFTRPDRPGWDLSPWDLLSLLGTHWLGDEFKADPLWTLLADLAGRDPKDPPGADFHPPPDWKTPFLQFGPPPEQPWLEQLAYILRARLTLALGFDDLPRLLAQPAQVFISSTRLDVYFSLAAHPLEVRLAGLDRDLGWLPAAGYAIFYHFE
jgi:hypothetical protein